MEKLYHIVGKLIQKSQVVQIEKRLSPTLASHLELNSSNNKIDKKLGGFCNIIFTIFILSAYTGQF